MKKMIMKNLNFSNKSQSLYSISRLFIIPMATTMLSTLCVTTPVYAEATAGTLDSQNTSDASDTQSNSTSSSSDTGLDVDKMFAEVQSEYSDMKGKYTNLANNYGDIPTTNLSKTYVDYLQSLEEAKANTGFTEKMKAIQNADISINDAAMSSTYSKIKGTVKSEILNKGLDISSAVDKYAQQTADKNKASVETIKSAVAASKKYTKFVDNYKSLLVSEDENGHEIPNPYADELTSKVLNSLGITSITEAVQKGQGFKGQYLTSTEIFEKLNNIGQKTSDDYERANDKDGLTDKEKAEKQKEEANKKYQEQLSANSSDKS